jgi:uracil-DNA glycosylase family 4
MKQSQISVLNHKIIQCKKCPRLAKYIRKIAVKKVKRYGQEKYWGRPLCGFGDPNAQILIIGLAPAAHGGNRTGRMFTGDNSGDWLAKTLFDNGFATKPTSQRVDDGFALINTYITAAVRCAPPDNKPTRQEINTCSEFLMQELLILNNVKVVVCLGKIAFDTLKQLFGIKGRRFFHGNCFSHNNKVILVSYHPSRQNTQTGRLGWDDWSKIFQRVRLILG